MNKLTTQAAHYFRPPRHSFWRWADGVDVLEWQDETTICYREDLIQVLRGVSHKGLPPLGAVLLMMTACQENWKSTNSNTDEVLNGLLPHLEKLDEGPSDEMLSYQIHQGCKFLDIISGLPFELRTGAGRMHLVQQTLDEIAFEYSAEDAASILDEFASGRLDEHVQLAREATSRKKFKLEVGLLNKALLRYKDVQGLERALRTGLQNIPAPAPLEVPQAEQSDVLEALEADPKTQSIARLTQRIMAAINIPMHARGSSDQPIGGVSDITNRGNFDRLLLSELAYDDQMLMARLVNNEALYLRREEPPARINRQRTILLDTTLKMWGTPRVFALSAALACSKDPKYQGSIAAYALGGDHYQQISLQSKNGVLETLSCLDPALHCIESLKVFLQEQPASATHECMLITDVYLVKTLQFQLLLSELKQPLDYLITVSRSGELEFFAYQQGNSKLISTASLDLEELLSAPSPSKSPRFPENTDLSAFMAIVPSPLRYLPMRVKPTDTNAFFVKELGGFVITAVQRLLYIPGWEAGAIELLNYVAAGNYCFGYEVGSGIVTLLITNRQKSLVMLYRFILESNEKQLFDLSENLLDVQEVVYHEGNYYIKTFEGVVAINSSSGKMSTSTPRQQSSFENGKLLKVDSGIQSIVRYLSTGYHVLINVHSIFINEQGLLTLDKQQLTLLNSNHLKFNSSGADRKKTKIGKKVEPETSLPGNAKVKLRRWTWEDGSEAVVDSRGMLHLRSSNENIPEITIVLALGKATACWAADGKFAGADYFTLGSKPAFVIKDDYYKIIPPTADEYTARGGVPVAEFYRDYIKPFIDNLR